MITKIIQWMQSMVTPKPTETAAPRVEPTLESLNQPKKKQQPRKPSNPKTKPLPEKKPSVPAPKSPLQKSGNRGVKKPNQSTKG